MSALEVLAPFQVFGDVDGEPLEDGYIYVGVKNLNPEVSPVQVYWDSALTIPAPQPIRTLGGYPSRMGTPSRMYVDADSYSISVKNKNGTFIYSLLDSASLQASANVIGGVQVVDSISDLRALSKDSPSTDAFVAGYYAPGDGGGGSYYYDPADTTSADNGGTIIVATDGGRWKLTTPRDVSVKQFGAKGDYVILTNTGTDDTTAFQNALNALSVVGGGSLYIPDGIFKITAALSYQDAPLMIHGAGMDDTFIIQTTAAANAINFTSTIVTNRVDGVSGHGGPGITLSVYDLTIGTTVAAERCINVIMTPYTNSQPFLVLENVSIRSVLSALIGFKYAVHGFNLNGIKIDNVYILGDATNSSIDAAQPFYCEAAIRLTGDNAAGFISHYWKGLTIYAYNRAVHCSNHYEGFYIQQFEFVHVSQGIYFDVSTCTNLHLENGHVDFKENGIYAERVNGFHSVNVDWLKQGGAPLVPAQTTEGHCVSLNLCQEFSIDGGRIWGFTAADNSDGILIGDCLNYVVNGVVIGGLGELNNGISIIGTQGGNISGNQITGVGVGIDVSAGADALHISDNTILNLVGASKVGINLGALATNCTVQNNDANVGVNFAVNNQGSSNYLSGNTGVGAISSSFADGDTTPNVHITGARTFTTGNTGATSITTFDNGFVGLEINVIALDANTTIVHAAAVAVPILTKSGANIVMALNSSAKFVRGPGAWYEI